MPSGPRFAGETDGYARPMPTPVPAPPRPIRAVLLDLDGTLLDPSLRIDARARAVVARVTERGVAIVLLSGRPVDSVRLHAGSISSSRWAAGLHGGVIADLRSGALERLGSLRREEVNAALATARRFGTTATLYGPDRWRAAERSAAVRLEERRSGVSATVVTEGELRQAVAVKGLLVGEPDRIDRCLHALREILPRTVSCFTTYPDLLEIVPSGVDKGRAARTILDRLGVAPADAIAIGDGPGDVSMLDLVGLPVAMGNAREAVQRHASVVTTAHGEDGVALALEHLVLGDDRAGERLRSAPRSGLERGE